MSSIGIVSVRTRPTPTPTSTPNKKHPNVEEETLIKNEDGKPEKKKAYLTLHNILLLSTLLHPFIYDMIGREQLFSQYTPTIDIWLIMVGIGFSVSIVTVISNIYEWNKVEKEKIQDQDELKMKAFCLSVQLCTLLLFVFNYAYINAAMWNIRYYSDQKYTHGGQDYNYLNELNGSSLRTNGVVSYVENHMIRQISNLQSLCYFSVAYFAQILGYCKYRQLLSSKQFK